MARAWLRSWLIETRGPQIELMRHFLGQHWSTDLMSSEQVRRAVIALFSLLGCSGLVILRLYLPKYAYLAAQPARDLYLSAVRADRIFFIAVSMFVSGLVALVLWHSLFPRISDYLVLRPLPVRLRQIFVARFLAAFLVVAAVTLDLNLPMSIGFPLLASLGRQQPAFGIRHVLAHASATIGGGFFCFLVFLGLQGVLLHLLPRRAFERLSLPIQVSLLVALLATGPYLLDLPNWHRVFASRPNWMVYFPPAWFLGWYELLLGSADIYFYRLAHIATAAVVLAGLTGFAAYLLSYWRHGARILERNRKVTAAKLWRGRFAVRVLDLLIPDSTEQAVFGFAALTLRRSHRHKFVLGMAGGLALVLALNATGVIVLSHARYDSTWPAWQLRSILAVPLMVSVVVISALIYALQIPVEVRANWIFRMADRRKRRELLDAVESVLLLYGVVPVSLLAVLMVVSRLGLRVGLVHGSLVGSLSLLLIETRLSEWRKLPFTCAYVPGRRNVWQVAGYYVLLLMVLAPAVSGLEARLFSQPIAIFITASAVGLLYLRVRAARMDHWGTVPLLFDESDEPLIIGLDLRP